ncbi:MAG: hypothetical protein WCF68_09650 [Terriglobales bacterium]
MKQILRQIAGLLIAFGAFMLPSAHAAGRDPASSRRVSFSETEDRVTLSNDYLELVFDRAHHTILRLAADHTGKHKFGNNLLASEGIRFDDDAPGKSTSGVEVVERRPDRVIIRLKWVPMVSGRQDPTEIKLTLGALDRGVHVQVTFPASRGIAAARSVRVALRQWFLLGLFDRGVVQYVAGQGQVFASRDRLRLFYTMDRENGSVALEPNNDSNSDIAETVLLSGDGSFASGIELRPRASQATIDRWTSFSSMRPAASYESEKQTLAFQIYANDLPFPVHHAENFIAGEDKGKDDAQAQRDSAAYFTAVYGSAVGVVGSYAEPGSAYPTLASPDRPYGDAFDFFDPDAWSTVTALSYSGDPLLQAEARRILERSESFQRPDGQMPHHFEAGAPTYLSIAKSSQTGPNIFWVIAASEYAAGSGDEAWLHVHYPHLRLATDWVLAKYDPGHKLLRADGPLFIDVFRRSGYTLDTNVAALYLLDRMAEVAEFCGDAESAERYRGRRRDLYTGIRAELWNGEDHFITQRNLDGSVRDLVDYDGNFAALAFGVPDEANARRLLHRLDAGVHTHPGGRGTWVSERRYEKEDCYGDNDGDSDTAMARIWWLDMATRVRLGDRSTFDTLLNTLESDLLRDVWMPERYDADGLPAHNGYYHEYPDIVTIVLREMRYGVHVGMRQVTIDPFGSARFDLRLGNLQVRYSPDEVSIKVPGSSTREFTVGGLRAHERYRLSTGERADTDAEGTLRFRARSGEFIDIRRSQSPARAIRSR